MKRILILTVALLGFLAGCHDTVAPKKPAEQGDSVKESMDSTLTVHYIDVGQGDATLLEFDGHAILIDAGHWKSDQAVDYLKTAGIKAIDIAVGTHPDADHIGQLAQIIGEFSVEEVWLSGNPSTSNTYLNVLQSIDASGTDYYEPRAGDVFDVGKMRIDVLYPERITGAANEESISMKLTYGDIQFVFTGDAGIKEEQQMIDTGTDLQAEILHLGHHGSNTSTSSAFLDAVSPEVAIYSAGADNSYGHPHAEVLAAVENSGAEVYGTDVNGTIIVETDGSSYNVVTNRTGIPTEGENRCININIASTAELQQIAGIGETYAKEIIRLRPFEAIEDLDDISGIGQATVEAIKEQNLACVEE
ncbi:MBL fold metallo-hydrolase [Planomicrobium okeanokoites]|uniref:MBL fold metallo-hydrolase n=1 Tax=Planomicrobium okeanokoites TaxID=244 RepID=UPI00356A881F